jgi:hypothetical protein
MYVCARGRENLTGTVRVHNVRLHAWAHRELYNARLFGVLPVDALKFIGHDGATGALFPAPLFCALFTENGSRVSWLWWETARWLSNKTDPARPRSTFTGQTG